ncbi:hypothetical protein [Fonticella tunisiensis]|uniref:hypothetical protein n=1 Tax=Fonticella tunisiensis TaxID=1096341 RepID=UPI001FA9CE8A|nr:hypothetical protein [Fonticella tunisiensis]
MAVSVDKTNKGVFKMPVLLKYPPSTIIESPGYGGKSICKVEFKKKKTYTMIGLDEARYPAIFNISCSI